MIELSLTRVCFMTFMCLLAGFVDSIAGGGGLISLTSYYAIGLPPIYALGNNKFSSTIGTFFACVNYGRKRTIIWRIAIVAASFAIVGSSIGAKLAIIFSQRIFRYMMLALLPIMTVVTLKKSDRRAERALITVRDEGGVRTVEAKGVSYIVLAVLGLIIGIYDGFFGPGTGTFYTIGLSLLGLPLLNAGGTTKVINLASNIAAVTVFMLNGTILYTLALPCTIAAIAGNLLGSEYAVKKGDKGIKAILLLVILLLYIKVISGIVLNS